MVDPRLVPIEIPLMDRPSPRLYHESDRPSLSETLGAAFRQENSLTSTAGTGFRNIRRFFEFNENFNPYEFLDTDDKSQYAPYIDRFMWARNEEDVEFIKLSIDQELRDRETLSRAGGAGFLAAMVAGTIDQINLIPIGGSLRGLGKISQTGKRVMAGARRGAIGGSIGAAAQEIPLYFNQYTRTPEEGIVAVGAGAILGSVLGGFAGMIPAKDRVKLQDDIRADMNPPTGKTFYGGFGGEENALQALDLAFNEGTIDQGAYRMARQLITDNPQFDAHSSIELVDAVRYAQDEELKASGWTQEQIDQINANPETRPRILGETQRKQEGDIVHTAIRLYHGHDADTVVEEFYHRFYDRLPEQDRKIYDDYHGTSGDARPVEEHFAQEGRDYFFSTGGHEKVGGIKSIFQKAKDSLRALIDRIRTIRGANIPNKIKEVYGKFGNKEFTEKTIDPNNPDIRYQMRREQTETPEFKRWFGDSKVVDEDGNPLVVYHGTPGKKINVFGERSKSKTTGNITAYFGHFFTSSINEANRYSRWNGYQEGNIIDVYLQIKNPYEMPYSEFDSFAMYEFNRMKELDFRFSDNDAVKFRNEAKKQVINRKKELQKLGYDGIIVITNSGTVTEYIAFEPTQIKSAISNRGTFDPNNPDIRYQIREVYKTLADLPEGVDPNKVRRPDIIPERVWKALAQVHPGLKVHTMKYLKKPAEIFNNLLEGSERHWKNWAGIGTDEAAETQIKRSANKYSVRHDQIFWDNYWTLQKRLTGEEQKLRGTQRGKISQRLFHHQALDQYKRDVFEALQELHGGKSITQAELSKKFSPEVMKAAREIGEIYNEFGKRLSAVGLLPEHLKEVLHTGYVHIPRIWKPGFVRKYRSALVKILKSEERGDDLPFLTSPEELEKIAMSNKAEEAIDEILSSPTGYLGIQINSTDPTDIGTAHFLEQRTIEIDSRKLWAEVEGQRIDFVETDPEIIFRNYLDSIMPDIILAERFNQSGKISGDVAITLRPAFESIIEEAQAKIKALGENKGKAYDEILEERDTAIKTLKAMRDVLRGDFHPNGRPDMSTFAARAPGLLLTMNAMQNLGGVVTSSLGDTVTLIAHVGLEPYAKGLSDFFRMQGTELFSKWKKEVVHVWGVAGEMASSARYGAVTDISDVGSGVTAPERWVNFWGRQMGLITGIDWWNAKMKLMTAFIVQHATLDVANKLVKAIDSGKIKNLNIETAGKIVSKDDLVDFGSMGIGLDDLVAIAREVKTNGEIHDGLTLPRTMQWKDQTLASRFESAMAKKVDSIIVTPGAGDKPLWTRYGVGKFVSQFKSYPMAAMRKILFRGLQNPDQKLAVGALASTMMGGLIYSLKMLERGETPAWDNPIQFLYESIDRAGLFGYLTDANNYIEKLTYNRVGIAPILGPLVGLESASRNRWQESLIDLALGPTGDTIEGYHRLLTSTLPHIMALPFGGGPTEGDINQAFKLVWFSRLSGFRSGMEWLRNQAIDQFAVNPKTNEHRAAYGD